MKNYAMVFVEIFQSQSEVEVESCARSSPDQKPRHAANRACRRKIDKNIFVKMPMQLNQYMEVFGFFNGSSINLRHFFLSQYLFLDYNQILF